MEVSLQENIRASASLPSVISFWWLKDIFNISLRRPLLLDDLYAPLTEDKSEVLTNRLKRNWRQEEEDRGLKNASLVRAIFRTFQSEYIASGLVTVFNDFVVRLLNPLLLHTVLQYFRHESNVAFYEAANSALGIVILSCCGIFSYNHLTYMGCHNGGKLRTAVCGLVYWKTLRLSKKTVHGRAMSSGHVINLMSNDVSRFDTVSVFIHWVWSAPLLTVVIAWILYDRVGWAPLIGVGIILIVVPLQCYLGILSSKIQLRTASETDERLGLVAELIAGIKMIKVFAWEKWISSRILRVRARELRMIRISGFIRGIYMILSLFVSRLMIFATLLAMVLVHGSDNLTSANVFMISAYYTVLGHAVGQMFVRGVMELAAVKVSMTRLEMYLKSEETAEESSHKNVLPQTKDLNFSIEIDSATAYWQRQLRLVESRTMLMYKNQPPTLNNISLRCGSDRKLVGIVGAVGSGKTSVLELIMGELKLEQNCGRVLVNGRISYAPQEPWIFNGSIRDNILFNEPWDDKQYQHVIDKCALREDFRQLPARDNTLVGERPSSLSTGQRARVNLARTIYRRADIYLLDDPLSSVDSQVGRDLFDNVIGPNGCLRDSIRLLITNQLEYLQHVDWIVVMEEGTVQLQGAPSEILREDVEVNLVKVEKDRKTKEVGVKSDLVNLSLELPIIPKESVLKRYLHMGYVHGMFYIGALFASTQIACSVADAFVAHWIRLEKSNYRDKSINGTDAESRTNAVDFSGGLNSRATSVLIGGFILLTILLLGMLRTLYFQCNTSYISAAIHRTMLDGVMQTPMSFFETNPSGRILNKFSRDLGAMDVQLPKLMIDALQMLLIICGASSVVLVLNPIFVLPMLLLVLLFTAVRSIYLKSSLYLKRLDGITRSPVFTHVGSTLSGLSVIRSSGAQSQMINQFDALQDLHTATWFMFQSTTIAFCQVLDMLAVIFMAIILLYFLFFQTDIDEERIGLTITQAMVMGGLISWGVRQSAAVSNAFVSVERVLEYVGLPKEEEKESPKTQVKNWPRGGQIEFRNVTYQCGNQTVLHDVNLLIRSRQKLGIVGRTGAGKSSLISALFRLPAFDGSILIDGVNTKDIPLETLRRNLSIIPQDPVLFQGTIRSNLDPFNEFTEKEIRSALVDVDLAHFTTDHPVHQNGNNFSVGQKQLLCLARALLRKNQIIILDEATANVDPLTDEMIQRTIRDRFRDCTVIAIAHRIKTVSDFDLVVVIDQGKIVDCGPPAVIIEKIQTHVIS